MAFELPYSKVLSDIGPGGGITTAVRGANALTEENLKNQIKNVEAQFAPFTVPAKAMSEMTYANIANPQYVAKMLGNPELAAQLTGNQVSNAVANITRPITGQAGTGSGTGNAFDTLAQWQSQVRQNRSPIGQLFDFITGRGKASPVQNNLNNAPSNNQQSQSGQAQPQQSYPTQGIQGQGADSGYSYDSNGNNVVATPQEQAAAGRGGSPSGPAVNLGGGITGTAVPEVGTGYTPEMAAQQRATNNTYAENIARAKGIIKRGEELGGQNGRDIAGFGKEYEGYLKTGYALDNLASITTNPIWQNMRNKVPLFQQKQLSVLKSLGTPEEQDMIGNFTTTAQEIVKDNLNSFTGTRLKGELGISQNMKVSDNDTVDVALGKLKASMLFNQLGKQISSLTPDLMKKNDWDKQKALQEAEKTIDFKKTKETIEDALTPKVTIVNPKTGARVTIPLSEAQRGGFKHNVSVNQGR